MDIIPQSEEVQTEEEQHSFYQALKQKYLEEYTPSSRIVIKGGKTNQNSKRKVAKLGHLKMIVLNNQQIITAGIGHQGLADLCPNVTDLDLASNNLEKWSEVAFILGHLPHLRYVNLSHNPLRINTEGQKDCLKVETVALNHTGVSINEILKLSDFLPHLKELQLCGNDYKDLASIEDSIDRGALNSLESLTLYSNRIQEWSEVWKLRNLPSLKYLIVSNNPLSDLFYDDVRSTKPDVCSTQENLHNADPSKASVSHDNVDESNNSTDDFVNSESVSSVSHDSDCITDIADMFLSEIIDNIAQSYHSSLCSEISDLPPQAPKDLEKLNYNYESDSVTGSGFNFNQNGEKVDLDQIVPELIGEDVVNNLRTSENDCHKNTNNPIKDFISPTLGSNTPDVLFSPSECLTKDPSPDQTGIPDDNGNDHGINREKENGGDQAGHQSCEDKSHINPETDKVSKNSVINSSDQTARQAHRATHTDGDESNTNCHPGDVLVQENRNACQNDTTHTLSKPCPFNNLEILCVSNCHISQEEELDALSRFPKLCNLRIQRNQLYSDLEPDTRRELYISSLPKVTILNGSEISATEREKSERNYLRHFMDVDKKPKSYSRLLDKHGPPVPLVNIDLKAGFQEWATLKFIYKGQEKFTEKVRLFDMVGSLRDLISKKLSIPKRGFVMFHNPCNPIHPEYERELTELRCELLPMSRLDFADGDEIHIDKRDLPKVFTR